MKIQILGPGCMKCRQLETNAREAAEKMGVTAEFEKISDIDQIMEMGVMMTPGLVIDGEVRSVGKVLSVDQIAAQLKGGN
jgi:small redox-active disulfide protein 2